MSYDEFWVQFDKRFNPGFFEVDEFGELVIGENGEPIRLIDREVHDAFSGFLHCTHTITIKNS